MLQSITTHWRTSLAGAAGLATLILCVYYGLMTPAQAAPLVPLCVGCLLASDGANAQGLLPLVETVLTAAAAPHSNGPTPTQETKGPPAP